MQPKTDPSLAIGVTEIIKTLISHPDHGMKANEIPGLVKDIFKAFQEASLASSEALAALPAPAESQETNRTEEPAAEPSTAPTAVVEHTAPTPAKAKSRSTAKTEAAPVVETPVAEASDAPANTTKARRSGSRKKSAEPASLEDQSVTEAIAQDAGTTVGATDSDDAPVDEVPLDPEAALEAKFSGKVTRTTWNGMKPEDAIQRDKIICLIDGLPRKMLHRHLLARYNMTPEEYRAWFHLRADYPMTAPGYSKEKSDYAKVVGLGTTQFQEKTKAAAEATETVSTQDTPPAPATPKTSRRSRKKQGASERQRTNA